jgi:hypothetical protein
VIGGDNGEIVELETVTRTSDGTAFCAVTTSDDAVLLNRDGVLQLRDALNDWLVANLEKSGPL